METMGNRRARLRSALIILIIATLPCYCLGLIVLQAANVTQQRNTQTATLTETVISSPGQTTVVPSLTSFVTRTPTITRTATITWTPSQTYTPFLPPTYTYTFTPSATVTPTSTPTITETSIPTSTYTNEPTPSDTFTPSVTPSESP